MIGRINTTRDRELLEFLPAAIELEQTPSSNAGSLIIWAIVILFVIAVAWACFGKIDIVAISQGKIIPSEYSKQVQAFEVAKIAAIHVKEGQQVQQGDILIELDATQAEADQLRIRHELDERQERIERLEWFERWIQNIETTSHVTLLSDPEQTDAAMPKQLALLEQERAELLSRLQQLASEQDKLNAELHMVAAEITKKERILPILKERVDALDTLRRKEFGSKLQYLELKQQWITEEQDLAVQQGRQQQLHAALASVQTQRQTLLSEQRKQKLGELQDLRIQLATLEQDAIKADERVKQYTLSAPITGQVQQLAIHTVGGVVTEAQPLMIIVPQDDILEVEARLLNKDIGFVQEGQKAEVKIDTFNFTKYGFIDAEILSISDDAIQDEQRGLIYNARLKLKQNGLNIEGKWVTLSPGMSVTAEVKTGTRRLIEFFLSPLLRYKQDSLGER